MTPKYKQSGPQIVKFLKTLVTRYENQLNGITVIADSEFGTVGIKQTLKRIFQANVAIDNYGNSSERYRYTPNQKRDLKTNERIIGRLTTQHKVERPIVYGNKSVSVHLQLAMMSDLLIVLYNLINNNPAHPHSFSYLKGKKF